MREHILVADIDNSNVNLECFDFLDTKTVYYRSKGKKNLICYYFSICLIISKLADIWFLSLKN